MKKSSLRTLILAGALALALAPLLAACGDNGDSHVGADAPVVADAMPDAVVYPPRAVVVAGNFTPGQPGVMAALDVTTRTVMQHVGPSLAVGDDPVLRHAGHELLRHQPIVGTRRRITTRMVVYQNDGRGPLGDRFAKYFPRMHE